MDKRYRCRFQTCNQQISDGITVSNGMIFVKAGHERELQTIPWIRDGLASGTITFCGEEVEPAPVADPEPERRPDPEPDPDGLNLAQAVTIAETYGMDRAGLKQLLDEGAIPGKLEPGRYAIPEDRLREYLSAGSAED